MARHQGDRQAGFENFSLATMTAFWQAVEGLPTDLREVFKKRYRDGLKQNQVAQQLGVSEDTVSHRYKDAKDRLRQSLRAWPSDPRAR